MDRHGVISACTLGNPVLGELITAMHRGGFHAVQMWRPYLDELVAAGATLASIAAELAAAGLVVDQLEGAFGWADAADEAAAIAEEQPLFEHAAALGSSAVLVGSLRPGTALGQLVEPFARLCEHAAGYGLACRLEFLPFGAIADLHTAVELLYAVDAPNAGLLLDSWHVFRANTPLEYIARIPGSLIHAVQINDLAGSFAPTATIEETVTNRVWPGDGWFDLRGLLNALSATGTEAEVSVEVIHPVAGESPEVLAHSARAALVRLFGDVT